jgi:hypothetical protein
LKHYVTQPSFYSAHSAYSADFDHLDKIFGLARLWGWVGFCRKPPVDKEVPNNGVETACYKFVKKLLRCVLTTRSPRAYKPLTDEDGGASGADGRLRSGVSNGTAGFVGVIAGKRLSRW